ncbi:MAG: hypothetical protein U5K30_04150, partial [Acidimicrobiales bacterium]|nr:hypothetical protein [Acidimicrobiales bacterium]
MFDRIHEMRTRIMTSPAFDGEPGARRDPVRGHHGPRDRGPRPAEYLWDVKNVVPFLKVDKGLADEADGVQLMKPMPGPRRPARPRPSGHGVFGTKMRSVIKLADEGRHRRHRRAAVRGRAPDPRRRARADPRARGRHPQPDQGRGRAAAATTRIAGTARRLSATSEVMFKLTLPEQDGLYADAASSIPTCLRVVALLGRVQPRRGQRASGPEPGLIASFSRALTQDLNAHQSAEEFDAALDEAIASIHAASGL